MSQKTYNKLVHEFMQLREEIPLFNVKTTLVPFELNFKNRFNRTTEGVKRGTIKATIHTIKAVVTIIFYFMLLRPAIADTIF